MVQRLTRDTALEEFQRVLHSDHQTAANAASQRAKSMWHAAHAYRIRDVELRAMALPIVGGKKKGNRTLAQEIVHLTERSGRRGAWRES